MSTSAAMAKSCAPSLRKTARPASPQKSSATNSSTRLLDSLHFLKRVQFCYRIAGATMYHYDAATALEELQEDALLPHPVKLRDMILRHQLGAQDAQLLNQEFQDYLSRFGELQKLGRVILEKLTSSAKKPA